MGRKAKNNMPKTISATESNIRMNFLYQASNLLAYTISNEISKKEKTDKNRKTSSSKSSTIKIKKGVATTTDKLIEKRKKKRVPLRLKRNKHISDIYNKKLLYDSSNNNNNNNKESDDKMDIETNKEVVISPSNEEIESSTKKLNSIVNEYYPLLPLARYYSNTLGIVAQKTVSRMDPNIKRSICKYCKTPLIPGLTSNIEIDDNESNYQVICKSCETKREYKSDNPEYCLFTEKAAITSEVYEQYCKVISQENKKGKKGK